MAQAAAVESKQKSEGDEVGDWVENVVQLGQYKDAFKKIFGASSLSAIGSITGPTFEKAIIRIMGGDSKINFEHLTKFTTAHRSLRALNGTSNTEKYAQYQKTRNIVAFYFLFFYFFFFFSFSLSQMFCGICVWKRLN